MYFLSLLPLLVFSNLCSFSPSLFFIPRFSFPALHFFSFPPYRIIFFDRSPFVSLPSHSAYWHRWSLSHAVSLSWLSHSPSLSVFLLICLPLSPSLPPSLSLSCSSLTISPRTVDSFYTLQKHPSFCSVKEKTLLFLFFLNRDNIFHFSFLAVVSSPTPTRCCGFNPKAGTNMFYFQLVIMAGTVLLAYYFEYTDTFPVHIQGFFCFDKAYSKPYPGPEDNSKAPPVLVYSLVTAIPTVTVSLCSTCKNKSSSTGARHAHISHTYITYMHDRPKTCDTHTHGWVLLINTWCLWIEREERCVGVYPRGLSALFVWMRSLS